MGLGGAATGQYMDNDLLEQLERRLGRWYARQRLGIERDTEKRVFHEGINFFHIENWYSIHGLIRGTLRLTGLYGRGQRNTARIRTRHNQVRLPQLPEAFEGFTVLHISDLHVDMNPAAMQRLAELLPDLDYDLCVLTGDYRGATCGPFDAALEGMARIRQQLRGPVYGVLGNHDSILMVPGLEDMGIDMLVNESVSFERNGESIHLVGIDDAHYFRVDNIEKAVSGIPHDEVSILLSHTPEVYRQAAHADLDLLLSGHTHGGQICLPGKVPLTLDSELPRRLGSGAWKYHQLNGYTSVGVGSSVVPVRFNCPPEITLHHLVRSQD